MKKSSGSICLVASAHAFRFFAVTGMHMRTRVQALRVARVGRQPVDFHPLQLAAPRR
jgi:hypothetical protein